MSDVTLLRKLTLKSTMKFGKFYDLTVQNILDLRGGRGIKYLIWVYYNSSNTSFMDDVLDILCVPEHARIDKPGKINENEMMEYSMKCKKHRMDLFHKLSEIEKNLIIGNSRKESSFLIKKKRQEINHQERKNNFKILNRERNQKHSR